MTELKPCRFCGIVPHAWLDDYINGRAVTDPEYIIECENGNCSVMPEVRGTYPYMDEVRTMWNEANILPTVQPDTEITADMVKTLREKTGAGMLHAKKALTESLGDMEEAVEWLRYKGTSYPYIPLIKRNPPRLDPDAVRETALQEAVLAVKTKWLSGAVDTHDELRGLALAEAAILDLIDKPAVQPDADAIRDEALNDAITHARQALVDAAYTFRGKTNTMSSAMFTAEDIVTAAIHSLITKKMQSNE